MSSIPANPFDAFQFKEEPIGSSIKTEHVNTSVPMIHKFIPEKMNEVETAFENKRQRAILSLSSEVVIGSASHYRIIINSLRSWKKNSHSTSSVDQYQIFLSELSVIQSDFPFMVLCTGILASQCRDIVAMRVTKDLIAEVGGDLTAAALSTLTIEKLEGIVKSCNYYKGKAKSLLKLAAQVSFLGSVPETFKGLTGLPGIGPKIANLCLSVAYKHCGKIVEIKDEIWSKDETVTSSPYFSSPDRIKSPMIGVTNLVTTTPMSNSRSEPESKVDLKAKEEKCEGGTVINIDSDIDSKRCGNSGTSVYREAVEISINSSSSSSSSRNSNDNISADLNESNPIDICSPGCGGETGGIIVDTHVHKVSKRIGWSKDAKCPENTRKILENLAPIADWEELTVLMINLGQTLCSPTPQCDKCPLKAYCGHAREVTANGPVVKIKAVKKAKKV